MNLPKVIIMPSVKEIHTVLPLTQITGLTHFKPQVTAYLLETWRNSFRLDLLNLARSF